MRVCLVLSQRSPTTFEVANLEDPDIPIGVYHTSALRPHQDPSSKPLTPLRKRGRPRKNFPGPSQRRRDQRG
ncbi:hypothetical protein TNCT_418141 [Trichonephila clavata]|uniref:Uncharacterized protein n=1 Tax=Trichonephila clavata TaxID=2740835 RepID=A0A8X6JEY0_TRICU|nr:hypothetical protein TNCT_418141 [Trichonephila clavata]